PRKEAPVRDALSALARRWVAEEDFWMLHARGPGEFTATVAPRSGQFLNVIPFGEHQEGEAYDLDPDNRFVGLRWLPGEGTKSLFFQIGPADAAVHFDLRVGGQRLRDQVYCGAALA